MSPSSLVSVEENPFVWIQHLPYALKSDDGCLTHCGNALLTQLQEKDEISVELVDRKSLKITILENPDSPAKRLALAAEVRCLLESSCKSASQYEIARSKITSADLI
jgi:hypothetical protein